MRVSPFVNRLLFIFAFLFAGHSMAASPDILTTASSGYDVVAYQTENAAKQGTTAHFSYHDGQAYLFSSKENRELFENNPEKYVPAFGGYCAMGVALGKKLPIDPEAFYVVDGKTYLNVNKTVQKRWLEDVPGNISVANDNWKKLENADPAKL